MVQPLLISESFYNFFDSIACSGSLCIWLALYVSPDYLPCFNLISISVFPISNVNINNALLQFNVDINVSPNRICVVYVSCHVIRVRNIHVHISRLYDYCWLFIRFAHIFAALPSFVFISLPAYIFVDRWHQ